MKISLLNGRIIAEGYLHEDVPFDVAGNNLSVCFDGKWGVSKYLSVNTGKNYASRSVVTLYKNGERVSAYTKKKVSMAGRTQEIVVFGKGFEMEMKQFISKEDNAIFVEMNFSVEESTDFTLLYGIGCAVGIPSVACECDYRYIGENAFFEMPINVLGRRCVHFVVSYEGGQAYCDGLLASFEEKRKQAYEEIDNISFPASVQTEEEKALYLSALFCCIENFKECGELKGFAAGCNYIVPLRTYYRDSYWTALSAYSYDITLVRKQICTLSRGVSPEGTCPSAVRQDFSAFWGGHYDSPSFFVMMTYDYINHSGDKAILQEKINGKSILELCLLVMNKQMERVDETGLLYKKGPFNKLDWADEVNRNGYVTYDEALYYRALYCMDKLCQAGDVDGERYRLAAQKVKNSINDILWDEQKGYYVNYVDGEFIEDNLSVDTVLVYLFGISNEVRSNRMLDAMENLLETKNNQLQEAGDYGVMCVYPFYKGVYSSYGKSSQDYEYHNGGNWPYWSAIYAYAKFLAGREWRYALESWFVYNLERGIFTPVEYFSPCRKSGSTLQAWSGAAAFTFDFIDKDSFFVPNHLK